MGSFTGFLKFWRYLLHVSVSHRLFVVTAFLNHVYIYIWYREVEQATCVAKGTEKAKLGLLHSSLSLSPDDTDATQTLLAIKEYTERKHHQQSCKSVNKWFAKFCRSCIIESQFEKGKGY